MTPIITVPERNFPQGTDSLPVTDIADGATRILVSATRVNWPDTGSQVVLLSLEISMDGGNNWSFLCSVGDHGGNPIHPATGLPKTHTLHRSPAFGHWSQGAGYCDARGCAAFGSLG
jgi:hypothetical protein